MSVLSPAAAAAAGLPPPPPGSPPPAFMGSRAPTSAAEAAAAAAAAALAMGEILPGVGLGSDPSAGRSLPPLPPHTAPLKKAASLPVATGSHLSPLRRHDSNGAAMRAPSLSKGALAGSEGPPSGVRLRPLSKGAPAPYLGGGSTVVRRSKRSVWCAKVSKALQSLIQKIHAVLARYFPSCFSHPATYTSLSEKARETRLRNDIANFALVPDEERFERIVKREVAYFQEKFGENSYTLFQFLEEARCLRGISETLYKKVLPRIRDAATSFISGKFVLASTEGLSVEEFSAMLLGFKQDLESARKLSLITKSEKGELVGSLKSEISRCILAIPSEEISFSETQRKLGGYLGGAVALKFLTQDEAVEVYRACLMDVALFGKAVQELVGTEEDKIIGRLEGFIVQEDSLRSAIEREAPLPLLFEGVKGQVYSAVLQQVEQTQQQAEIRRMIDESFEEAKAQITQETEARF